MEYLSRRDFLKYTGGGLSALSLGTLAAACDGGSQEAAPSGKSVTAITWGPPWVDEAKAISDQWAEATGNNVTWQLHEAASAAVLAKIEAQWPNPELDLVNASDPVFITMTRENWLEPVDLSLVPNLANVPDNLIIKDEQGHPMSIPGSVQAILWAYRNDTMPKPLTTLSDLLDDELRGQVCMVNPLGHSGATFVSLALERGGDEFNIDPGFEFAKELAERGNIGRVANSEVEMINSVTSGETSVSFWNISGWHTIAADFDITLLNKAESPGARDFLLSDGFVVLRGPNSGVAFDLANFFISPENNHVYNDNLGVGTTNSQAEPAEAASRYLYDTPDEYAELGYVPDWEYLSEEVEGWNSRWEKEIVPLL